ncbi:hypothetical protein GPJ56_008045 [Histomonas meleagridis]|uniref:uncharacterized protein n=1 Tax=Histomonas meleagridis TaxID=135588 RepID=UPI0035597A28|nr:hypothetical protein GPJ56_008045 [Histomonas meleagridis]KAH0804917.1 hypothetical protein GO595_002310 [Histomonas meleagridis]
MHFLSFPEKRISELLNSGRINENSFGFITELDIKEACNLTKLSNLDSTTLNQILQFCAAHKLPISHDVTLLELRNIAHWVIKNESDNVSFTNMTTMMHQAIDLSVLGQNAQNLSHTSMRKDVNDFMELAIQKTDQMIGDQEVARGELSELFSISESSMEAKLIADFQNKVMRAHEQSKVVRDDSEQVSEPKQSSEQENDE